MSDTLGKELFEDVTIEHGGKSLILSNRRKLLTLEQINLILEVFLHHESNLSKGVLSSEQCIKKVTEKEVQSRLDQGQMRFIIDKNTQSLLAAMSVVPEMDKNGKFFSLTRRSGINITRYLNQFKDSEVEHVKGLSTIFMDRFEKLYDHLPIYSLTTSAGMNKFYSERASQSPGSYIPVYPDRIHINDPLLAEKMHITETHCGTPQTLAWINSAFLDRYCKKVLFDNLIKKVS